MIWFSFGLIFLALLGLSHGHWGKGKSYKKKDVEVLEVQDDFDWTDLILPVFNFGFGDDFRNMRRQGCTCQLTTPSPREICPGNATMNVTLGQHGWWQGKEMRRYKGRFRRHSHGRHHPKYKKAPLKSGCPMNVPTIPPPCPERLAVRRVRRHSPRKKGNGGNKYRKKDQSSSEEDGGFFEKFKRMGRKGPKTQPQKCVDPKTRETRIYYPGEQGKTITRSSTYATRTYNTRYYGNRDREEEEEDYDREATQPTFSINTSPINPTSKKEIFASRTSTDWESSTRESNSWSSSQSDQSDLSNSARGSSSSGGSPSSSPPLQWISSDTFSIQPSPSYSSGVSSSWSSSQGGINDLLNTERKWSSGGGSQSSNQPSQWSSWSASAIQPSPSSSYSAGASSSSQVGLNDLLNNEKKWSSVSTPGASFSSQWSSSSWSESSRSIDASRTWSSSRSESSSSAGGSLDDVLRGGAGGWKNSISASSASGWSGSSSSSSVTMRSEETNKPLGGDGKISREDLARGNKSDRGSGEEDDEENKKETTQTNKSSGTESVKWGNSGSKAEERNTWSQVSTAPESNPKPTYNIDQFTKKLSESPVTENILMYTPKFDERNIWANTRPSPPPTDNNFKLNLDQFTKRENTVPPSTEDIFKYTPKFDERNIWALTKNNALPETVAPFTLNQDLFTKRASEAANTQSSLNVPKFDDRNQWPEAQTTNHISTASNPNFNLMDIVNKQNEERERALRTTTTATSPTTTPTSTTTTSTSTKTTTTTPTSTSTSTTTTPTTSTSTTTTTTRTTTTTVAVTRWEQISNGRGSGLDDLLNEKKWAESTSTTQSTLPPSTASSKMEQHTTKNSLLETTNLITRRRGDHHNNPESPTFQPELTTKNSLLESVGGSGAKTEPSTRSNNANQPYTTRGSLLDEVVNSGLGTKPPADNGVKNDKKSEGATTIAEIVTDGGRSTRNALDSQWSGSSARPDNRATDSQAIAKNGGPDEKNKSPLNDLLGGGSGGAAASNGKEMTFSDTGVTQARVNPPPAQDNFHIAGGGGDAPVRPPETINPVPDKQNGGGGSVNDFLAVKKDQQPTVLDDDVHRKYVFYLMFGSPNACPTCCNACSGAQPKITINQITNSSGDARDIKWMDTNTMSDGNGGSFYIGHRRGNQSASIQPMAEIKMTQEQKLCNTPFTAFFA